MPNRWSDGAESIRRHRALTDLTEQSLSFVNK